MGRLESKFQSKALEYLKEIRKTDKRLFFWKNMSTNDNGIPDITGCYYGYFFAIEIKKSGGSLSPVQEEQIARIKEAFGTVIALKDSIDYKHKIEEVLNDIRTKYQLQKCSCLNKR